MVLLRIVNHRPSVFSVFFGEDDFVRLIPGLNEVPADKADAFLSHPSVKIRLQKGHFDVFQAPVSRRRPPETSDGEPEIRNETDDAVDVKPADAKAAGVAKAKSTAEKLAEIEFLYDVPRLRLLTKDPSARVRNAATKRLELIDSAGRKPADESETTAGDPAGDRA
jgi:hypothetical protein